MYKPDWSLRSVVMNDPGLKPIDRLKWVAYVAANERNINRKRNEPIAPASDLLNRLKNASKKLYYVWIGYTGNVIVSKNAPGTVFEWVSRSKRFTQEDRDARRYKRTPALMEKVNQVFRRLRSIPTMRDTTTRDMPKYKGDGWARKGTSTFTVDFSANTIKIWPSANAPKQEGYWSFALPPDNANFDIDCMVKADYYGIVCENDPNVAQLYGWNGEKTAIAACAAGAWGRGKTVEEARCKAVANSL
jgi:hypothetical protein